MHMGYILTYGHRLHFFQLRLDFSEPYVEYADRMEAEANFVFPICYLDKADSFSGQKLGDEVVFSVKPNLALMVDRSDLDVVIVLRFAQFFREPPG